MAQSQGPRSTGTLGLHVVDLLWGCEEGYLQGEVAALAMPAEAALMGCARCQAVAFRALPRVDDRGMP